MERQRDFDTPHDVALVECGGETCSVAEVPHLAEDEVGGPLEGRGGEARGGVEAVRENKFATVAHLLRRDAGVGKA